MPIKLNHPGCPCCGERCWCWTPEGSAGDAAVSTGKTPAITLYDSAGDDVDRGTGWVSADSWDFTATVSGQGKFSGSIPTDWDVTSDWTASLWFYAPAGTDDHALFGIYDNGTSYYVRVWAETEFGSDVVKVEVEWWTGSSWATLTQTASSFTRETWVHCTVRHDATNEQFKVDLNNGAAGTTLSYSGLTIRTAGTTFEFGGLERATMAGNAMEADVLKVCPELWTDDEMSSDYAGGAGIDCGGEPGDNVDAKPCTHCSTIGVPTTVSVEINGFGLPCDAGWWAAADFGNPAAACAALNAISVNVDNDLETCFEGETAIAQIVLAARNCDWNEVGAGQSSVGPIDTVLVTIDSVAGPPAKCVLVVELGEYIGAPLVWVPRIRFQLTSFVVSTELYPGLGGESVPWLNGQGALCTAGGHPVAWAIVKAVLA